MQTVDQMFSIQDQGFGAGQFVYRNFAVSVQIAFFDNFEEGKSIPKFDECVCIDEDGHINKPKFVTEEEDVLVIMCYAD